MSEQCEHSPTLGDSWVGPYSRNENNSYYCWKCKIELDIIEVTKNGIRISIEYKEKLVA